LKQIEVIVPKMAQPVKNTAFFRECDGLGRRDSEKDAVRWVAKRGHFLHALRESDTLKCLLLIQCCSTNSLPGCPELLSELIVAC
jgi:hypothetical protein